MSKKVLEILGEKFGPRVLSTHSQFGDDTAVVDPSAWKEIALFLRDDPRARMNLFLDLTAVDYQGLQTPRFEVVVHLRSLEHHHMVRLKTRIGDDEGEEDMELESLIEVWRGVDWFEREVYDLFGVRFLGHPNLRRILLYPEFQGHPLRKDYPADRIQPLVPYREGYEKLAPFGPDEGMPFGRQSYDYNKRDMGRDDGPAVPKDTLTRVSEEDGSGTA